MRYLISISQIAVFVKVAEIQDLTKAGIALHITPSLLQKVNQFGTMLLKRTTRSVSLTHQGLLFLEKAQRIITDVDEAIGAVYLASTEIKGHLNVTTYSFK